LARFGALPLGGGNGHKLPETSIVGGRVVAYRSRPGKCVSALRAYLRYLGENIMDAKKYNFPEEISGDEDNRATRSLMAAKLLFEMEFDVYGDELISALEESNLFRAEFKDLAGKPYVRGGDDGAFAFRFGYLAALFYTAGKLESSLPAWVLDAEYGDGRCDISLPSPRRDKGRRALR
jgi:hypothetical protein